MIFNQDETAIHGYNPYLAAKNISGSGAGFLLLRDLWQDSDAFSEGLNSRRHAGANDSWYQSDGYLDGISESNSLASRFLM